MKLIGFHQYHVALWDRNLNWNFGRSVIVMLEKLRIGLRRNSVTKDRW